MDYDVKCGMKNVMCVSRRGAIKFNSCTQTHNVGPSTHMGLLVVVVVQQPQTHGSKCKVRVEWKRDPYIPTGRASIGCDPSPPNS